VIAETLDADKKPVLKNVVLRTGGTIDMPPLAIPVKPDPSPINLPYMLPVDIVEKNPYDVESRTVDIPNALMDPALTINVLNEVVTISPIFTYPKLPPIINEFTVSDETTNCVVLTVLNIPSNPIVVLAVRLFTLKLLANPLLVENDIVDMLLAVKIPVLSIFVLKTGGTANEPVPVIPVNPDPSPINLAYITPAEIVEKKP